MTALTDATAPAEGTGGKKNLGLALLVICVAQLMVVLDATIVNIALPFIQRDLDFSEANLTWMVTSYALAFGSLLLLGGRLGDLYGRRRVFIIGLIIFAVASALGGIATSQSLILAARSMQGLGGALASPAALALITTNFPAGSERNRAFAVYAAMSGAGAAVGLVLGGWLTGMGWDLGGVFIDGWRLTFLINTPIGLGAALLATRALDESRGEKTRLDIAGTVTASVGLLAIVYGLSNAANPEYGWDDKTTIGCLVAGVALLIAFIVIEVKTPTPLLPLRIFADSSRAASFAAMMLMPAAMMSMFFYLGRYIQDVMGYSPLKAGVAFLPFSVMIIITATTASKLIARVSPRWLAGFGLALAAGALYGFSLLPNDTTFPIDQTVASYTTDLLPYILMMAGGMGFVFVPLTLTAVHGVRQEDSGVGSGVLNTMQQVGGALGLAVLATVASNAMTDIAKEITKAGEAAMKAAAEAGAPMPSAEQMQEFQRIAFEQIFTYGATRSFVVGALMVLVAAVVILLFLRVSHDELAQDASDHPEAGLHM